MGGGYYDRDYQPVPEPFVAPIVATATPIVPAFSAKAEDLFNHNTGIHSDLDPVGKNFQSNSPSPIVCAIDVTGSMGNWAKTVWDKLPMFFGQMNMRGYVTDPAISFAGVGDAYTDKAPLQVSEFKSGIALDQAIEKIWLEGAGGGQTYESYEICAYFYARKCQIPNAKKPFFFFMGDEGFYKNVKAAQVKRVIGDDIPEDLVSENIFRELRNKFYVFFIHKPYFDPEVDQKQLAKWRAVVGNDRILEMREPKAIIDIMLGAIAIVGGTRTLTTYIDDLEERGQTPQRIDEVKRVLEPVVATLNNPIFGPPGSYSTDFDPSDQPDGPQAGAGIPSVPAEFICPITESIFIDPVLLADGFNYERAAIAEWLSENATSPMTEKPLSSKVLLPSPIKGRLQDWKKANGVQ